ncbi:MAG TPA: VanW family protein [Terriglobales bacterium]|nr:VanW family protein [Terriglobales bacterium]
MGRSYPVAPVTFVLLLAATFARGGDAPPSASDRMRADSVATEPSADFPVTLGSFSTTLVGSLPERTHNVRLAASALDGALLRPGEELSFNDRVGPRTAERGYEPAPVILREVRQVQVGGGVCQVASTLFDAALLAGLTPVERHRHSSPVDYVALGEDATIAWGVKDLRLRNDLEQDVRLRIEVVGSTLVARFEGREEGDAYELETVVDDAPAPDDVAGLPGRDVDLYRVRAGAPEGGSGGTDRELIHRDHYPPSRTRSGDR